MFKMTSIGNLKKEGSCLRLKGKSVMPAHAGTQVGLLVSRIQRLDSAYAGMTEGEIDFEPMDD